MQITLHARRVVVDAERQVGGIGNVEKEALDVAFRRADIGGSCQYRAVGAVVLGEADSVDGRLCVVAGAAEEDRQARRLHLGGLDDDGLLFLRRKHRGLAGRAHDQHRGRALILLENRNNVRNAAKSTEPSLLNGVMSATNDPASIFLDIAVSDISQCHSGRATPAFQGGGSRNPVHTEPLLGRRCAYRPLGGYWVPALRGDDEQNTSHSPYHALPASQRRRGPAERRRAPAAPAHPSARSRPAR